MLSTFSEDSPENSPANGPASGSETSATANDHLSATQPPATQRSSTQRSSTQPTPPLEKRSGRLWLVSFAVTVVIASIIFLPALLPGLLLGLPLAPGANMVSMTPVSGLMTLKTMATDAMPYELALANQKPTLIEFYADWCTTCQSMSATVAALHATYGTQLNVVMLDIDDPQWAETIESFGASGVPQFTLLDVDHQSVHTWVGKVPKSIFQNALDQLLS